MAHRNKAAACGRIIAALLLIVALNLGLSNTLLADARTVPYSGGDTENVPAAAAGLCNIRCERGARGCSYLFDIEVFETAWEPVYEVAIYVADGSVEPLSWPKNWQAGEIPPGAAFSGYLVFYTVDHPIEAGSVQAGFGLVSRSGSVTIRWFPAGANGTLMGKMSRIDLSCPTANEATSWGSIKATYR